jgi:hypothetical protein
MITQILIYLLPCLSQGNMYGEILGPDVRTNSALIQGMTSTLSVVSEFEMQNRVIDPLTPAIWLNL